MTEISGLEVKIEGSGSFDSCQRFVRRARETGSYDLFVVYARPSCDWVKLRKGKRDLRTGKVRTGNTSERLWPFIDEKQKIDRKYK